MPFYSCFFGFVRLVGTDKPFYLSIGNLSSLQLDRKHYSLQIETESRREYIGKDLSMSDIVCNGQENAEK